MATAPWATALAVATCTTEAVAMAAASAGHGAQTLASATVLTEGPVAPGSAELPIDSLCANQSEEQRLSSCLQMHVGATSSIFFLTSY